MDNYWQEYVEAFDYFSAAEIRPGCHPRKMVHDSGAERAIVLVHGLTDSPYFLTAIADHFYNTLGYDVFMPLLHMHGLREPRQMQGVALEEWQRNVRFAVNQAGQHQRRVSIGGLSTGGALSLWASLADPLVTGELYLFSAAVGLSNSFGFIPGWLKESVLGISPVVYFDSGKPLIGLNPYRYDRVPLNSAMELAKLIRINKTLVRRFMRQKRSLPKTFAVWTEADSVISISALKKFGELAGDRRFCSFAVPRHLQLEHACVVLKDPVYSENPVPGEPPLEPANPRFNQMLAALDHFLSET